jgi:hypothetical protein
MLPGTKKDGLRRLDFLTVALFQEYQTDPVRYANFFKLFHLLD